MFIARTIFGMSALYILGNPALDNIRPQELDAPSKVARQIFEPTVDQAMNFLRRYVPDEVKYTELDHPLAIADKALGKENAAL
jgi:hypothetical protein